MYSYDDLAHKLEVSLKTVRRWIKAEGIKPVDKDGKTLLFDDKALATLQDNLTTKRDKHQAVIDAGVANIKKTKTPGDSVQIQDLLEQLDKASHTLASDEYAKTVAEHVTDLLKHDEDVNKVISTLTASVNRARVLDNQHDQLVDEVRQLGDKVDHLYDRLRKTIRSFDYRKMAQVNAKVLMKQMTSKQTFQKAGDKYGLQK